MLLELSRAHFKTPENYTKKGGTTITNFAWTKDSPKVKDCEVFWYYLAD
jgi:hypothetical protein